MASPPTTTTTTTKNYNNNNHTLIDIKPQLPPTRFSMDSTIPFADDDDEDEILKRQHRVHFFRPLSAANTWIISFFVVVHLIAFAATMLVNDCWYYSGGDCALSPLGRLSFQPLPENPLLGPSASALDQMGALRERYLVKHHEIWRILTSPWLHSGVVHLIINLSCVLFVGIHLEKEFGPLRIGVIYIVSAFTGSLTAVLFLQDRPTVASSGALFGLLGAMTSALLRNWKFYIGKFSALMALFCIFSINFLLGLLPYVNNLSNIGGFLSGFFLGFVLLFSPRIHPKVQTKGGLFDYDAKCSAKLRQKLDKPVQRIIFLALYSLLLAGVIVAVLHGISANKYCGWCHYIDCVPSKWWSCSDKGTYCQSMVDSGHLTLTCTGTDKFKVFPFANTSQARMEDLCNLICS